jgi:hypothetical protein
LRALDVVGLGVAAGQPAIELSDGIIGGCQRLHAAAEAGLQRLAVGPAHRHGVVRIVDLRQRRPIEIQHQVEVARVFVLRQIIVEAAQQLPAAAGAGIARPEPADLCLAEEVIAEEDLVCPLAAHDHLDAGRAHLL